MKKLFFPTLFLAFLLCSASLSSSAATRTLYTSQPAFIAELGSSLTDDYGPSSGYPAGFGLYSAVVMNAFFGETQYESTFHNVPDWNIVPSSEYYCAGCNGSFKLNFSGTSFTIGSLGVPGVGFDVRSNDSRLPYTAFVTYGDGSTENIGLPIGPSYFAITSPDLIQTIHFGLPSGGITGSGSFSIDNLTIGGSIPPDPIPTVSQWGLMFLFLGLLTGATVFLRKRSRSTSVA